MMSVIRPTSDPLFYNPVFKVLHATAVGNITPHKQVIHSVSSQDTVLDTFKVLEKYNITAVPVYDATDTTFQGFVSLLDILRFAWYKSRDTAMIQDKKMCLTDAKIHSATIDDLLSVPFTQPGNKCDPFIAIMDTDSVAKAARLLEKGYHRLPVRNVRGDLINILSQSDILSFLGKQLRKAGQQWDFLSEIKITASKYDDAVYVYADETVTQVVDRIVRRGVSCLGLVDRSTQRIVGNFSPSDLTAYLNPDNVGKITKFMTVHEYLDVFSPESLHPAVITVNESSLYDAIELMYSSQLHHVWAVNDEMHPVMCVSLTDILMELRLLKIYTQPALANMSSDVNNMIQQLNSLLSLQPITTPSSFMEAILAPPKLVRHPQQYMEQPVSIYQRKPAVATVKETKSEWIVEISKFNPPLEKGPDSLKVNMLEGTQNTLCITRHDCPGQWSKCVKVPTSVDKASITADYNESLHMLILTGAKLDKATDSDNAVIINIQ